MVKKLHRILAVASAAFFIASSAFAQSAGNVTAHAFALGKGAGSSGYTSLLCSSAQLAVGQSAADPICQTITGDVTISSGGVTAIGTAKVVQAMIALNAIDNTRLAQMANATFKCRNTAGTGNSEDCTASQVRTLLSLVIGTNVEAWDADLDCLAALAGTGILRRTGAGTCSNGTSVSNSELATMSAYTLKANNSSSAAVPSDMDVTALTLKASPGASDVVLIQDASASNAFKRTTVGGLSGGGSGVSSLNGQTGALAEWAPPRGRLTLATGTPVMTTSQNSKTTIYYTPYVGNLIPLYDGTNMVPTVFSEISVLTTDTTKNPAAIGASKVNDWFVWSDGGTLRLSHGPDWTSDTARSAGTALTLVNGIYLNSVAITNGPAASRGTYVGTTRADAGAGTLSFIFGSSAVGGGSAWFGVWNMYNRVSIPSGIVTDSTGSWTYATATFRATNNQNGMRISAVFGQVEDAINASFTSYMTNGAASAGVLGVGLNTTSSNTGTATGGQAVNNPASLTSLLSAFPSFGFNFIQALEYAAGTGNVTFYGSNSIPAVYGNSLTATLRM